MSLLWEDSEVPDHCVFKPLTHVLGDPACAALTFLPIERSKDMIIAALKDNYVVAVQALTSSGKSMKIPLFLYDFYFIPPSVSEKYPILVVQQSNFAAEKIVESLVRFGGWSRWQIHLRTGKHDADLFKKGRTSLSVITYGLLWRWLTGHAGENDSSGADLGFLLSRYAAVFLDEFADLSPKMVEASRLVGRLVHDRRLWKDVRLVVAGYAINTEYVGKILGEHQLVVCTGRKHTMERCVVAPTIANN
jgi:hypothetical protein